MTIANQDLSFLIGKIAAFTRVTGHFPLGRHCLPPSFQFFFRTKAGANQAPIQQFPGIQRQQHPAPNRCTLLTLVGDAG